MIKNSLSLSLVILTILVSGCASIVDGGDKAVRFNSNPIGAKISIFDRKNRLVAVQTTPAIVPLKRFYDVFRAQNYRIVFEMPGYRREEARLDCTMNSWYLGNIVFGGLIGILIVDPSTGAMWAFTKDEVSFDMESLGTNPEEIKTTREYEESLKKRLAPKTATN